MCSWAITNNITHSAQRDLLKILKSSGGHSTVPDDPRTLLSTPRTNVYKSVEPGMYSHIGIKQALDKLIYLTYKPLQRIDILINIDGLPLSKSSSSQIYPILCSIFGYPNVSVVGIYYGYEKPSNANDFLQDFVVEATQLTQNGFIYQEHTLSFTIKGFICDAPAKSFITYTKGHTGLFRVQSVCRKESILKVEFVFPKLIQNTEQIKIFVISYNHNIT